MKKVISIVVLLLPVIGLSGTIPVAEHVNVSEVPEVILAPDFDTVEIANDEESRWGYGLLLSAGDRMAVKFRPEQYPVTLVKAAYWPLTWSDWPDSWAASCNLVFYGDGDVPGSELGRMDDVEAEYAGWFNWFDVSELGIIIEDGSFYFAVEYVHDSVPGLAIDMGSPPHHASWMYNVGTGWRSWDTVDVDVLPVPMGDSLDLMLRLKGLVEDTTTSMIELEPDKETQPSIITVTDSQIEYFLPAGGSVDIDLWDASGRHVCSIYAGQARAGRNTLNWNSDFLPQGIYFVGLEVLGRFVTAQAVVLH